MSIIVSKTHQAGNSAAVQQSQLGHSIRQLKPTEEIIANKFTAVHRQAIKKKPSSAIQKNNLISDGPEPEIISNKSSVEQVDSRELALSVALRGREQDKKKFNTKHRFVYKILFSGDASFLQRDLESLRLTLVTKGKCICDMAKLDPKDYALRKYLLLSILESDYQLNTNEIQSLTKAKDVIKSEHGAYIAKVLAHLETTYQTLDASSEVNRIGIKEYMAAYKLADGDARDVNNPITILPLFRLLKKQNTEQAFLESLDTHHDKLQVALSRETSQHPSRASALRQHIIVSQLNQIKTIRTIFNVNKAYTEAWKKSNAVNLPAPIDLLEMTLRIVSGEIVSAVTDLVRSFAGVKIGVTVVRNLLNAMIVHYINSVLQQPKVQGLFRAVSAYQQMMEQLRKNISPGAVLSAKRPYAQ